MLLPKGENRSGNAAGYRPICLLSVVGKLYERMIRGRIEEEMVGNDLSEQQYGFRKGHSTIQAISRLLEIRKTTKRKWCAAIMLDVKNAFNSACWGTLLRKLRRRNFSQYLVNVLESYFRRRWVVVGSKSVEVYAGVPQGSVLGPILWNLYYDEVLKLHYPQGITTIAFADDIALVVTSEERTELQYNACEALWKIEEWMWNHHLEVAPQKSEAIILKGTRKREEIKFEIGGKNIDIKKNVKYIQKTAKKAEQRVTTLSRLMPNIGGPAARKRKILMEVMNSITLYGAPIWHSVIEIKRYRGMLEKLQRRAMLRMASAYRTTSTAAPYVITKTLPIDLLVEERRLTYIQGGRITPQYRKQIRKDSIAKWQERWDETVEVAQWTKRLIPRLERWIEATHTETDYFTSQILTGHGSFKTYTSEKMK